MTDTQSSLGDVLTNLPAVRAAKKIKTLGPVHRRLIEPLDDSEQGRELAYQHTVFCQTSLPYRDPGDDVREWKRRQGAVVLEVQAGKIADLSAQDLVQVGLPWGTKPRLILAHLNAEALRQRSAEIEIESSLSAFVKRIRGFDNGREIRAFKDQLGRLSASLIRLAVFREDSAFQIDTKIITAFELWGAANYERQRVLWPSVIKLSTEYFTSLQAHAVPLYEGDLAALAHSAMALDLYAWLAQRLCRVEAMKPAFIPWMAIKEQFGPGYARMNKFKEVFRTALRQVHARYDRARFDLDDRGMTLHHSQPPVTKRQIALPAKSGT